MILYAHRSLPCGVLSSTYSNGGVYFRSCLTIYNKSIVLLSRVGTIFVNVKATYLRESRIHSSPLIKLICILLLDVSRCLSARCNKTLRVSIDRFPMTVTSLPTQSKMENLAHHWLPISGIELFCSLNVFLRHNYTKCLAFVFLCNFFFCKKASAYGLSAIGVWK